MFSSVHDGVPYLVLDLYLVDSHRASDRQYGSDPQIISTTSTITFLPLDTI